MTDSALALASCVLEGRLNSLHPIPYLRASPSFLLSFRWHTLGFRHNNMRYALCDFRFVVLYGLSCAFNNLLRFCGRLTSEGSVGERFTK